MSANTTTIAVDVMGGDLGHGEAVAGALAALSKNPSLKIILVGDNSSIADALSAAPDYFANSIEIVHTDDVIAMDASPTSAVRTHKQSSMRLAIDLVNEQRAHACVSSGNTGALVAISKFVLKTIAGIKRPAIVTPIPSHNGITVMLDLGANASCDQRNLIDFALMGSVVAQFDYHIEKPRIGLLNIGTESGKGNAVLNETDQFLRETDLNYVGFIEGTDIFSDSIDVVVSDGFTGNIALKTMEGFANYFLTKMSTVSTGKNGQSIIEKASALLDPRTHNGASLVGLNGVVIKSHGASDATAIGYAIETAANEANSKLPCQIKNTVEHFNQTFRSQNV